VVSVATVGTCESCGVEGEELTAVHRRYLAAPDGTRAERVLDETERWCVACLTSYPHEPAH
jgi:hypothetical protein